MGNPTSKFDGRYSHVFPEDCTYTYSTFLPPGTRGVISKEDWVWCVETINEQMPSNATTALLLFFIFFSVILAIIGLRQEIAWMAVIGIIMFLIVFLIAVAVMSCSDQQSLHKVCATINKRLDGCAEVAQHVSGKSSTYYLKIDVSRLKELRANKACEPPQEVKPPAYDYAAITVEPSAPSKVTGSTKKVDRTAAWTKAERLAQIQKLRDDGILSGEEFENAKNRI